MKISLSFLLLVSITGVSARTDYACCTEECDSLDNSQMCKNNPNQVECGSRNWLEGYDYLCMKVVCCEEENCGGRCSEQRHVTGECISTDSIDSEANEFLTVGKGHVCEPTSDMTATKCCADDSCEDCGIDFIFSGTCEEHFTNNNNGNVLARRDTDCGAPVDMCCFDPDDMGNCDTGRCQSYDRTYQQCEADDFWFVCASSQIDGDPHIRLWNSTFIDFHGICDLVLFDLPTFMDGVGFKAHARTSGRYEYSYIETAAIQIGSDVLEVGSFGEHFFNGVQGANIFPASMGSVATVSYEMLDKKKHVFTIDFGRGQQVIVRTFKDIVGVHFENANGFEGGVGLMGQFGTGKMVARDGETIINDANEFGMEWQVRDNEPVLFQAARAPIFPEQCRMPNLEEKQRRLGQRVISEEEASAACEKWGSKSANCVFDVIATGDLSMAEMGPIA